MMGRVKTAIPTDFPLFGAPWLMSGIAAVVARSRLINLIPPIANIVISNVPGSPVPLYFAGAKVISYYPVSIVVHSMALNVTVQSYAGRLDYGLIACRRAVPDIVDLGDHLLTEHQALLARAHEVLAAQAKAEPSAKPVVAVVGSKPVAATAARVAAKGVIKTKPKSKAEPQLKLVGAKAAAPKPRKVPTAKRVAVRAVR
jgi:diacylglycerol O-acyltransferase / wax synthase